MGHRQGLQETSGGSVGGLVLVTDRAGINIAPGVLVQGGPPEPLLDEVLRPLDAGVTGEARIMGPLEDVPPQGMRHEQAARGTVAGAGLILQRGLDPSLDLPGDCSDEAWGRKDGDCLWRGAFPPGNQDDRRG